MTRHLRNVAPSGDADNGVLLQPIGAARNLTGEVVERIAREIASGRLQPGARLPTERELMNALGVSRTVIREAVSALKSEGLVVTRQGSGAFVAADASRVPFRIESADLSPVEDIFNLMELRLAIEVEASALAARRASSRQIGMVERALAGIDRAIERGDSAVNEDFAFHRAIADAAGNTQFVRLLEFLGRHVIPRQSIRVTLTAPEEQRDYLMRIQSEHRRIAEAIRARDPAAARRVMRAHLSNSLARYRKLIERAPKPESNEKPA
jgi:GntR family transcriptional regulator, transcriptional repressor for pyruvate dehydrogenase complex